MSFSGILSIALGTWPNIKCDVKFSRLEYPMSFVDYMPYPEDWDFRFVDYDNGEIPEPRPLNFLTVYTKRFTDGRTTLRMAYAPEVNTLFFWSDKL